MIEMLLPLEMAVIKMNLVLENGVWQNAIKQDTTPLIFLKRQIQEWFDENIKNKYIPFYRGNAFYVSFESEEDAMLYKLSDWSPTRKS
jgi:hypothetical protein